MLSSETISPSKRTGYASDHRSWRICNNGDGEHWYVMFTQNTRDSWERKKVLSGSLQECVDYVNSVAERTD